MCAREFKPGMVFLLKVASFITSGRRQARAIRYNSDLCFVLFWCSGLLGSRGVMSALRKKVTNTHSKLSSCVSFNIMSCNYLFCSVESQAERLSSLPTTATLPNGDNSNGRDSTSAAESSTCREGQSEVNEGGVCLLQEASDSVEPAAKRPAQVESDSVSDRVWDGIVELGWMTSSFPCRKSYKCYSWYVPMPDLRQKNLMLLLPAWCVAMLNVASKAWLCCVIVSGSLV